MTHFGKLMVSYVSEDGTAHHALLYSMKMMSKSRMQAVRALHKPVSQNRAIDV